MSTHAEQSNFGDSYDEQEQQGISRQWDAVGDCCGAKD
jgi:hypothetical protein